MTNETYSSSPQWKYDVFLSFRGEDTRKNFTDHLYSALIGRGIHTFRDDEKLERGKNIEPELFKAIEESRFAIVVLSSDTASSTWCLKELSKIVECKRVMGQIVFAVFFHVEPSHVGNQDGDYEKALAKHEQAYRDKVNEWREALTEIVNVSSRWDLKQRNESEVIEEIVNDISSKLDSASSSISDDLVGIDLRMEKLLRYLDIGSLEDVRTIGIWGKKGIGKTTLAEQAFERIKDQFEAKCFVSSVRNEHERHGLVHLQKLLHKSLLKSEANIPNFRIGINILRGRLYNKKVLIVLDDVAKLDEIEKIVGKSSEQHNWFGKGSRIIVTTRNEHLLRSFGEKSIYEIEKLTQDEALQLFCKKAFEKGQLDDEYKEISNEIVKYANGLPLAITNLGSFLLKRDVESWSSELARLEEHPDEIYKL
ncbi:hypothetical protein UlMin_005045 [Ulmus minor]